MKMNRATAGRGRSGDWGAQRNAAWGNLDGFPEVLMLHLSLNDKQTQNQDLFLEDPPRAWSGGCLKRRSKDKVSAVRVILT